MTDIVRRLRVQANCNKMGIFATAADEIEHLTLDLHTERAAVVALRAEVAGLREDAAALSELREIWEDCKLARRGQKFPRGSLTRKFDAIDAARKAAP